MDPTEGTTYGWQVAKGILKSLPKIGKHKLPKPKPSFASPDRSVVYPAEPKSDHKLFDDETGGSEARKFK